MRCFPKLDENQIVGKFFLCSALLFEVLTLFNHLEVIVELGALCDTRHTPRTF